MCGSPRRVLWIDDEVLPDALEVTFLRGIGYAVHCSPNAGEAVIRLRENKYDAILLDLHLPDQSGLDVLQLVSSLRLETPVAVLTGFGGVDSAVAAMKLGAVDYREKPLQGRELASLLQQVCEPTVTPDTEHANRQWIQGACDRLALCNSHDECLAVMCRLIRDRRLPLHAFVGAAQALNQLLRSHERSLALLVSGMRHSILAPLKLRAPLHPEVRAAMVTLEALPRREEHVTLATRMNISRAYLNRLLLAETGFHHRDWMKAAGMRVAIRRLLESGDRISQIAYEAGYNHPSRFDKDFCETFGVAPRELRGRVAQ